MIQLSEQFKTSRWAAYSADTTPEAAREAFAKRYGVQPVKVWTSGPVVLAGPVPHAATSDQVGHYEQPELLGVGT